MPRNTRNIRSVNARLGPEETARTGGLNRGYIALTIWWRVAASNLQERPETAGNGRVWRVCGAAAGRRRENLLRFTIVDHHFFAPWRNCPKTKLG